MEEMAGNVILTVFGVNASLWFNNVMGNVGRIYQNAGKNVVQKIFKVAKVIFKTFAFFQTRPTVLHCQALLRVRL